MRKVGKCNAEEKNYELVYSDADTIIDHFSLEQILSDIDDGTIVDDIAIQRDADQWKKKFKTLLVHTVLINLSILPISMVQRGTGGGVKKQLIDGKQRLSVFAQFKNNEFTLSSICPPVKMRRVVMTEKLDENGNIVTERVKGKKKATPVMVPKRDENGNIVTEIIQYKVAGKYYDELPDSLKKQFCRYKKMPQYTHINYTDEEMQLQMLRDNTSVKMTPGQIGSVVCGEELADWQHSFRMNNLFLNNSTWDEGQIRKNFIERCITEAFVLFISDDTDQKWNSSYDKNVETFKSNAAEGILNSFTETVDGLDKVVSMHPMLKQYLTYKNLHIILAAYSHFCDMDVRYNQDCFGEFLCKWFTDIKDNTDYETEGNTGTKQKTTVLGKLAIMDDECRKYMEEYGTVDGCKCNNIDDTTDDIQSVSDADNLNVEQSEECELNVDISLNTKINDIIKIEGEIERKRFNIKAVMTVSDFHYGNFNNDTLKAFCGYFNTLSEFERADLIENTEFYLDCIYDYSKGTDTSDFYTLDNILCLLSVFNGMCDVVSDTIFKRWLKQFVSEYTETCVYANIREYQDNYIMGRISYLRSSLEKYNIEKTRESEVA